MIVPDGTLGKFRNPPVAHSHMRSPIPASWTPALLSIFRIVAAFLYMAHGTQKLFGFPGAKASTALVLLSWFGIGGIIEAFGGALLLLGLFTRPVAFVAAGEMAIAYFKVHAPGGFWPLLNHGELAALYCFAFLYMAAAGGGPWSVDALLKRAPRDSSR